MPEKWAAINANTAAIGDANSGLVADVAKNTEDIESVAKALNTAVQDIDTRISVISNTVDGNTAQINDLTANLANVKVKDVDVTTSYGVGLSLDGTNVKVNVDLDTLAAAVIAKHDVPAPIAANISVADFGTYKNSNVQAVLESLDTRITAAAGGGVQTIVANPGSGITVDSSDVNNPAISINIEEDSALTINENNKIDLV